jgi:diguanylate cyclase (GGDEF)-like protein
VAKILVVDDEPSLREMLNDILSLEEFDVVTAANGEEGLRKVYDEAPDLVLLDCSMPVLDGYEVLERMRADPLLVNKPVIMLTVLSSEYNELRGLKLGVDDYITKPFKPSLLLARVKAILERKTQSMSANPLTSLAGNAVIKEETEKRIASGISFAMIYADLNSFKAFNDKYGFQRGDEIIKNTASILLQSVKEYGQPGDFVGHIGGDDFIILTSPERYAGVASHIIKMFDEGIPNFYEQDDRKQGFIVSVDRNNNLQKYPLMSISLAVISTTITKITHYGQLSAIAAELKKVAKRNACSTFVVEKRRE